MLIMTGRNFPTKTGGLANTEVSMVSSPPTMCGWTNDAKNPNMEKSCRLHGDDPIPLYVP